MALNNNALSFFEDEKYNQTPQEFAPIIITDNLKTPENIGHIIRIAGNVGCRKVLVINSGEKQRLTKINRVSQVAGDVVNWQFCLVQEAIELIPNEYIITALETSPGSKNIFTTTLPKKMALIVGNETNGICTQLLNIAHLHIHIPMCGSIKSMNVSHATTICMFQWVNQHVLIT